MLNIQNFLLSHNDHSEALEALQKQYAVKTSLYEDDMIVFNYDQINSPRFDSLVDDCRGLILSWDFKTIYSRPFTRFYNYGEGNISFDFSHCKIMEKVDGSLMCMNYHPVKNIWFVSTRKMGYAEGTTIFGNTFRSLFMRAIGLPGNISDEDFTAYMNEYIPEKDRRYTFIFEMVSPETRVVKRYDEYAIYLLAIRDKTIEENSYIDTTRYVEKLPFARLPKMYSFDNIDDIKASMKELAPLDEGYVCFDPFNESRVKVKSPAYVAVHHMRDNGVVNPKRIATLVYENEYEEYLAYFSEDRDLFEPYIKAYSIMVEEVNKTYNSFKDIKSQKDFALAIKDLKFNWVLFAMRAGKSLQEILDSAPENKKLNLLEFFKKN